MAPWARAPHIDTAVVALAALWLWRKGHMTARARLGCHVTTLRRAWVTWWALSWGVFGLREGFLLVWTHDVL